MTPEEEKILLEKLDAMTKKIDLLENPPEVEDEKEDVDPRIEIAEKALRKALLTHFSKEKLDTMDLEQLDIAMSMKEDFKPPKGIKPPTGGNEQKEDTDLNIPESYRAHFGSETNYGELIK